MNAKTDTCNKYNKQNKWSIWPNIGDDDGSFGIWRAGRAALVRFEENDPKSCDGVVLALNVAKKGAVEIIIVEANLQHGRPGWYAPS
jgi:hypothetical protein